MHCQKHLFSIPDDHHYLNCAYFSPLLKSVEDAGINAIRKTRTPWHTKPHHFFNESQQLRTLFAELIHAPDAKNVAIIPAASYGLSTVARNLPNKTSGKIIIAGEQFPSNVYPWNRYCRESGAQMHVVEPPKPLDGRGKKWNEHILEAIGPDTLMVAIGNIHWSDGTLFNLEAIGKRTQEVGALLVIDGTQSIGALPFDVQAIKPDAVICAGYKWLMGPYSIGLAWFGPRLLDGIPLEENWLGRKNSENFAGLVNYADEYQPGATRYDVGERSNFILVPMMIEALQQILQWQPGRIQTYCRNLTATLSTGLPEYGYRIEDSAWRAHHLFGIHLPARIPIEKLDHRLQEHNIHVSVRGAALRVSPHVYNQQTDLEKLFDVLAHF